MSNLNVLRVLRRTWRADLFAGMVVFLVALPLCLGIATASGVEPIAGLVSGIVGGLVIASLSGSQLSVSGPAAGLVVIVVSAIQTLGGFPAFLCALVLAGAMQIALGLLRAGGLAAFMPGAVIKGMLASIGLLLIIKQLPLALGMLPHDAIPRSAAHGAQSAVLPPLIDTPFGVLCPASLAIALASLVLLFGWQSAWARRFAVVRAIPGPLAVVLLGIGISAVLDAFAPHLAPLAEQRVNVPSLASLDALSHALVLPDFARLLDADIWRMALTLAIVASLETLLSLEAVEQLDPQRRRALPDRELKAQGIGNIVAGVLGGLPLTAVIVRGSANVQAGAQTRLSAFVHGMLLLASVFVLTGVLNLIPLACLASILIQTGYKLAKPQWFIAAAREGADRLLPFVATIVGVLATDLLIGIGIGLAVSLLIALRASVERAVMITHHDGHYLLSFRKDVSFVARATLAKCLAQVPDRATLIIDAERADFVDRDIRDALQAFIDAAPRRGIRIEMPHWPPRLAPARRRLAWPLPRVLGW